jgi:hypothetical protein
MIQSIKKVVANSIILSLEIDFSIKTNIMIRDNPLKIYKNIIKMLYIMLEKFSKFPLTIRLKLRQQ